jgi:hypothetical protein
MSRKSKKPVFAPAEDADEADEGPIDLEADFGDLSADEQEALITDAEERGEDVSHLRVRVNARKRHSWANVAELVRLAPEEDDDGVPIKGLIKRFNRPFDDLKIRDYALKHCGGGEYAILYYDEKHRFKDREPFEVGGRPKTARETEDSIVHTPEPEPEPTPRYEDVRDDSREQDFQRTIQEMQHRQELDRLRAEHRAEQSRLEGKLDRLLNQPQKNNTAELLTALGAALAPFAPAIAEKLTSGPKDHVKEMMSFMEKMHIEQQKALKDALAEKKHGDPIQNATTKMLDLAIMNALGPKKDPEQLMYSMMEKMIPNLTERALDIAAMRMDRDDGDENKGPLGMIEKFGDMVKPLLMRNAPPEGVAPSPYPGVPHPAMQAPPAPLPHPAPAPIQPGVYPYTNAPAEPAPQAQAGQGAPSQPAPAGPMPGQPNPAPQPQPGQTAPTVQHTPADAPDIHPQIFIFAKQYLDTGKDGSELAGWVDERLSHIEAGTGEQGEVRLLSEKAIEFLETVSPAAIIDHFFAAAPAEILPYFCDPSGAVAPHARQFVLEFCDFFFSSDDHDHEMFDTEATPEAIAAAEAAEPTVVEASAVEVQPTPEAGPIQGVPTTVTPATPEGVTQ